MPPKKGQTPAATGVADQTSETRMGQVDDPSRKEHYPHEVLQAVYIMLHEDIAGIARHGKGAEMPDTDLRDMVRTATERNIWLDKLAAFSRQQARYAHGDSTSVMMSAEDIEQQRIKEKALREILELYSDQAEVLARYDKTVQMSTDVNEEDSPEKQFLTKFYLNFVLFRTESPAERPVPTIRATEIQETLNSLGDPHLAKPGEAVEVGGVGYVPLPPKPDFMKIVPCKNASSVEIQNHHWIRFLAVVAPLINHVISVAQGATASSMPFKLFERTRFVRHRTAAGYDYEFTGVVVTIVELHLLAFFYEQWEHSLNGLKDYAKSLEEEARQQNIAEKLKKLLL